VQEQPCDQGHPPGSMGNETQVNSARPQCTPPDGPTAAHQSPPGETIAPEADSVLQAATDLGNAMADLALVLQEAARARGPSGSALQLPDDPTADSWAAIRSAHLCAEDSLRNAKRTLAAIGIPSEHHDPPDGSTKRRAKAHGAEKRRSIPRIGTVNASIAAMRDRPATQLKALCAIISANADPSSSHDLLELQQVARRLWQSANGFRSRTTPLSDSPVGSLASGRAEHWSRPRPTDEAQAAGASLGPSGIDIPVESSESADDM
jgi:hypothetical protein